MDWLDYREKLGIGFNDKEKYLYFKIRIFNFLDHVNCSISIEDYVAYCSMTASALQPRSTYDDEGINYRHIRSIIREHSSDLVSFLAYYIPLINIRSKENTRPDFKVQLVNYLNSSHILYDLLSDKDGCFVFPKGVPELDRALVSEPLDWLSRYPAAQKAFTSALRSYAEAPDDKASEIADSFRKALECFCQEFFSNTKSLENNIAIVGDFLKEKGIPAEIRNNFEKAIDLYCKYNNNYAKHRDATSDKVLEFIMYQTGNFIRLLITCNK